jgi:hypothetical protein
MNWKIKLLKFIRFGWVILCLFVLCISFYYSSDDPKNDIEIFLIWSMVALSFPSGFVVALVFTFLIILLGDSPNTMLDSAYLFIFVTWFAYFVVGYLQWFILVPKLVKWIKKKWISS